MVKEVERRLRVNEPVIKFITVRVDEEQKRLAKIKAIRDTKVRGKGTRAAAAEAAAAEAAANAPALTPEPAAPESAPAEGARNDSGQRVNFCPSCGIADNVRRLGRFWWA